MSMNSKQLRELVRETLEYLHPVIPYSKVAEDLVLMTIAHESHNGMYLKQMGGPALGICQMEPATHDDIWDNFLEYRQELSQMLYEINTCEIDELVWNLKYAIAMCRVHYYRVPEALPDDLIGLSDYAKKYYNTELGKATAEKYLDAYYYFYGV